MAITDVWQDVWEDVWQDVWGEGGVVATPSPSSKRRSTARKRRKPKVIWLEGTQPLLTPEVVPVIASQPATVLKFQAPPKPKLVEVRFTATEGGEDRASIRGEARFVPVVAAVVAHESSDVPQISVTVTGIGYDEDDLEVLAMLMGDYEHP